MCRILEPLSQIMLKPQFYALRMFTHELYLYVSYHVQIEGLLNNPGLANHFVH